MFDSRQFISVIAVTLLIGCASKSSAPNVKLSYGKIEKKEQMSGKPAESTLVGGFGGMAAIPAATSDAAAKNIQQASRAYRAKYRYTIKRLDGTTIKIVTEKDFFSRKDCVAIEKGHSYNLRLVDDEICRSPELAEQRKKKAAARASDCVQAKRMMVIAQSDRDLMRSRETVEVSCQFRKG